MPKRRYTLSVHGLVDPLLRRGDIDDRVYNLDTMKEGAKLHSFFQSIQEPSYESEVFLSHLFIFDDAEILLEGRADGIIPGTPPIIDEIKSTIAPLEEFWKSQEAWHLGQAECYALMYLLNRGGGKAKIRLTYLSQTSSAHMEREYDFDLEELEKDVRSLLEAFLNCEREEEEWKKRRNASIKGLPFPFPAYREGQREMAKYIYRTAKKGGYIFVEAPTGIGKSMSAVYPALKAMGEGSVSRVFYLTAKGSGKESAAQALSILREKGLDFRSATLSSKEDLCLSEKRECNPDSCPFAKGYYDKLPEALKKAYSPEGTIDPKRAKEIAWELGVCPFELLLDASLRADFVITDYNHFSDPFAKLDRYFGEEADPSKDFLLIDEAHNLPDRARSSYTETIDVASLKTARKALKGYPKRGYSTDMRHLLEAIEEEGHNDSEPHMLEPLPEGFVEALSSLTERRKRDFHAKKPFPPLPEMAKDISIKAHRLSRLIEECPDLKPFYRPLGKNNAEMGLLCLDASPYLSRDLSRVKGAAFYSATLSPISHYGETILDRKDVPYLLLPSPFPKENMRLLIAPYASLRYKDREESFHTVVSYIEAFLSSRKKGHFFVYFPSFSYLRKAKDAISLPPKARLSVQRERMDDKEKEEFLRPFRKRPKGLRVAYLVLGGSFGEGIDLPGECLEGVAVVGIGLPQVCFENEALREEADKKGQDGFATAYANKGVVRVMQAVGRLIRTEEDRGMALLIDTRFLRGEYRRIISRLYPSYRLVTTAEDIKEEASSFWKGDE